MLRKMAPNHFTVNYIYRQYHLTPEDIRHSAPAKMPGNIFRIHNSENVLGLALALYISFAISSRKTALMMRTIFGLDVTYQTVLNYARAAAYHCHRFNLQHKDSIDDILGGDETYIKVCGKHWYVFFFISPEKKSIVAYHLADNRGTIPAVAAIDEAIKTADPEQKVTLVTDGNPSYVAALLYLNKGKDEENKTKHIQVIGLKNLDEDSTEYRVFKQISERLNRTYKYHARPAAGFNSPNGAMALTALFVTHYNFLRPHSALNYRIPIQIPQLKHIRTIQQRWIQIIKMAQ